jgi:steroid 5-alpha reductase family enzyme
VREAIVTLALGWAGCAAAGALLWLRSLRLHDAGIVDVAWGLFCVGLTGWFRWRSPVAASGAQWLHLALVTVWGVRLSAHIAWRSRGRGEDRRYAAMRARGGRRFASRSLFTVFLLQATLACALSAPLFAVQWSSSVSIPLFGCGVALWAVGMFWETVGDWQLQRFRTDPANRGRVLDSGLWRYSRHPNYFGEATLWWGFGAMAAAAGASWTLLAPALMTWLLLRVSGVTLLERTISPGRPEYGGYVRRTSAFLPWPPSAGAGRGLR